jgi:DNA-binding response OmpR family regulator
VTESIRVLVVDDDPDVQDLLEDYLLEQGYEVLSADNAAAASELLGGSHRWWCCSMSASRERTP